MTEEAPSGLTRLVVRGAGLAAAGHLLTQAISLASYLALARLASPHEFGELAAGSVVVGVGMLLSESGMLAAVVQRRDRLEEAASTAFVATVTAGVLLALGALALAPAVGLFFHSHTVTLVAAAMSGYIAIRQTMIVPDALMQRRFSFVRRVVLEPAGGLAVAGAAIGATAAGLGVWGLVIGQYAGVVVQAVLSWSLVGWRPKLRLVSFAMWRELVRFGRHVIASEGITRGTAEGRNLIVGRFLGTAMLGQYTYAWRMAAQPVMLVTNAVAYVLMPALSRIADDPERFRGAVLRSLRWVALLGIPASLVLLPLGEPAMVVLFGEPWREAGRALEALCAISAAGAIMALAAETWKSAGRPQWLPRMNMLVGAVALASAAGLAQIGLVAVAIGLSAAALAGAAFALFGIARVTATPLERVLRPLVAPALAGSVMAGAIFALEHAVVHADRHGTAGGLALLVAEGAVAVAVYIGALTLLARDDVRALRRAALDYGASS